MPCRGDGLPLTGGGCGEGINRLQRCSLEELR